MTDFDPQAALDALYNEYRERAEATIAAFSGELQRNFFPLATLLNAAEMLARGLQVTIVGTRDTGDTQALLRAVATAASLPNLVLQCVSPSQALPAAHPAHAKGMRAGRATAYLCEGPVCSAPSKRNRTSPLAFRKS